MARASSRGIARRAPQGLSRGVYCKAARLPLGMPRLPIRVFTTPARAPRLLRLSWLIKPPRPGGGVAENDRSILYLHRRAPARVSLRPGSIPPPLPPRLPLAASSCSPLLRCPPDPASRPSSESKVSTPPPSRESSSQASNPSRTA